VVVSVTVHAAVLVMPVPVKPTAPQLVSEALLLLRKLTVPVGVVPAAVVTVVVSVNATLVVGVAVLVVRTTVAGVALVIVMLAAVPLDAANPVPPL
jgi:hypothetical protein